MNIKFTVYEQLIEYILYKRDRNPHKDWWHIRWWTTVYSYCRWNINHNKLNEKYRNFLDSYDWNDLFLKMIKEWYFWNFERRYLKKYEEKFKDNYLFNFIFWISSEKAHKHDYYFKYAETIDKIGFKYLLKSYKQNPNYLFTNIALWSYLQHNQKYDLALKFYKKALKLDKDNPWVLWKLAVLYNSMGKLEYLLESEKIIKKVIKLLPDVPRPYDWAARILNVLGKYYEAIKMIERYEKITEGKHRTFEPFLWKAQAYYNLGDFKKAKEELNKVNLYYFWQGYKFIYDELSSSLDVILNELKEV